VGNVKDRVFYIFLALRGLIMELDTAIMFAVGAFVYTIICCLAVGKEVKVLLGVYGVVAILICAAEAALK
jgi:uncharacterized membrane protein